MAQAIIATQQRFHDRLSRLQNEQSEAVQAGDAYTLRGFNSVLALTKLQLSQAIPDGAIPLRKHIERHFPAAITNMSANSGVSRPTAEHAIAQTDAAAKPIAAHPAGA